MKIKFLILFLIILAITACFNKSDNQEFTIKSFRDIPGVTEDEIAAIEELQKKYSSFSYAMFPSTEAFLREDGTIGGFALFFTDWLSEIFDIPFIPEHGTMTSVIDGLKTGKIDFSGDLTPSYERKKTYYMTDAIAHRWLCYFKLNRTESFSEIAKTRPLQFVLVEGTTIAVDVLRYVTDAFEPIFVAEYEEVYELLESGQADALIAENTVEAFFDIYGDIVMENFLPLIDSPVSLTTQNPELAPIISVVQKAIINGWYSYFSELYNQGYNEYRKHKLLSSLSFREREFINDNPVIPFTAEYDNYPSSFFNTRINQWQGISFDVLKEIEALTGLKFELVNDEKTEWHEILGMLETGQAFFVAELLWTAEREGRFLWPSTSIFTDRPVLISKTDLPNISINKVPSLKIGLPKATAHAELFHLWFPNHPNYIIYGSQDATFEALFNNEVDMIMISYSNMLYMTNYLERVDVKPNIIFDHTYDSTFGFNINAYHLRSIFNKTLELIDTRTISDQWTQRTYDYRAKVAEAQRPWLIGAAVMSFVIFALITIIFYRNRKVQVERAVLRESEERIQLLLDAMPLSANLVNKNNQSLAVNEESVRLFGLKNKKEYRERIFKDLSPEFQPDGNFSNVKGPKLFKKAFDTGYVRYQWMHKKPDGELIPCEITMVRVKYKDENVIAVYARDLREEIAAKNKIHETEQQKNAVTEAYDSLQSILEKLPVGVIILDVINNWAIEYANKAVLNLFGYEKLEETKGCSGLDYLVETQPDGRKAKDIVREMFTNEGTVVEFQCIKQTGELFISRIISNNLTFKGKIVSLAVVEDITAEQEYRQKLENAATREQEANQLKSRFLAKMSHEIRTPMNAIIGMTELALRENSNDSKNEHIKTVKQASSNLLAIINDILDFSKIEAGKMEILPQEYSVASLLNDLISIIRMRVADSEVRFAVKVNSKIPQTLYGDETKIRQAVLNILNNAVKYTENGFVSFSIDAEIVDKETVNIIFEVADSGRGIKAEDIDRLFDDFIQFDIEKNKGIEGVGLGLAITKSFVTSMDGNISVKSEYGKGSTFTITLPQRYKSTQALAKIDQPEKKSVLIYERRDIYAESLEFAIRTLDANGVLVTSGTELYKKMEANTYDFLFISFGLYKKNEDTILKFGHKTKTVILAEFGEVIPEKNLKFLSMPVYCSQIADLFNGIYDNSSYSDKDENLARFSAPNARVLIVDDINTNLKVAQGLLTPYNMRVDICNNGKAAIEMVKTESYDLVFMDHKMPGMDGVEATKHIREFEKSFPVPHPPLPIIALTANAVSGMMEMFIENGFNDFLSKPIDTVKLDLILEKWIPKGKQVRK